MGKIATRHSDVFTVSALQIKETQKMRKLEILAVTLLLFAPEASAQISAGPIGPFAMVDADGDLMGGAVPTAPVDVEPTDWAVALNTPTGRGFVMVTRSSDLAKLDSFRQVYFAFASTDCTGQAYMNDPFVDGLDGGPRLAVHNQTLYALGDSPASITIRSQQAPSGVCTPDLIGPFSLLPATAIGNIGDAFTPPFRIVTAATQFTSVPMLDRMSQWLLAAVLVGAIVIYDRRRMAPSGVS